MAGLNPRKKRRKEPGDVSEAPSLVKFGEVVVFLVERRMGANRRRFLSGLARGKGFRVDDRFSGAVTHVVSEGLSAEEVLKWLGRNGGADISVSSAKPMLLHSTWFTASMEANHPISVQPTHILQVSPTDVSTLPQCAQLSTIAPYACQRRTPLGQPNARFTDALQTLAENARFGDSDGRALAFTRAACVLKSLPSPLSSVRDLDGLPGVGEHSRAVIKELLEEQSCPEVNRVLCDEHYRTMKLFTSIWGVGVKTAELWFHNGLRTLQDVRTKPDLRLTKEQEAGVAHYEDLMEPVTSYEAKAVYELIKDTCSSRLPDTIVILTGGFRRGKPSGHDADLLITHPQEGREIGLLSWLLEELQHQGYILFADYKKNTYEQSRAKMHSSSSSNSMDQFERCFTIFKLPSDLVKSASEGESGRRDTEHPVAAAVAAAAARRESSADGEGGAACPAETAASAEESAVSEGPRCPRRSWRAVRVDLVVCPHRQHAFALLGWTGSQNTFLNATTEQQIFSHLQLPFVEPCFRNA
ncbi:DNA-directed DNA/RNA polymerase mu-like isoform X3 [Petromyzon marinus]|uniref:DNA-directed DNA/RNA polymerase mu n=1 Tax=Petromyzon marinus TaxID=7757 RepID=A0AAJ7WRY6_PETMA|nr:DNA-directed DNA/RNA polymerase mu-like isoform X3 [Petromyzon marinus]